MYWYITECSSKQNNSIISPTNKLCKMSEPHQRTQSGKLRRANIYSENTRRAQHKQQHRHILVGVENANNVEDVDPDDEIQLFHQSPTTLTSTQVSILKNAAEGLGIKDEDCIDKSWRRTWNIGTWCIDKTISICANIVQPNIAGMWANIENVDFKIVQDLSNKYKSYNLEKSAATVTASNRVVRIQGRWTPYIIDSLYSAELVRPEEVEITYVNITQSRLFFWVIVGDGNEYLCTPSSDTIELISNHIPEWAFDIMETNAGGGLSIKLEGSKQAQDAKGRRGSIKSNSTQLSINSTGWLQMVGSERNVKSLYEAFAIAIRSLMHSLHLAAFMESLEYKIPKES